MSKSSVIEIILAGKSARAIRELGIPARFKGKCLGNFEGYEKTVAFCVDYLELNRGVFIHGPCGTGKTHLAIGLLLHEFSRGFDKGRKGYFLPTSELFLELKHGFDMNQSETATLDKYCAYHTLVLDDLGAERLSDWSRTIFYLIIDRAYRNKKQIIITSNLSLDGLANNFDDRIASRLAEMCMIAELSGPDRRLSA